MADFGCRGRGSVCGVPGVGGFAFGVGHSDVSGTVPEEAQQVEAGRMSVPFECPSCGELMDGPTPYRGWDSAGRKYKCICGCGVSTPAEKHVSATNKEI